MLFINCDWEIPGNVKVQGYLQSKKSGIAAHLSAAADTGIAVAGTWYPVQGVFHNIPFEDFAIAADKITYIGARPFEFEIVGACSFQTASPNLAVAITLKHNTTVLTEVQITGLCKTAGEPYALTGAAVVTMNYGDTMQIVCTSNLDGSTLTFNTFLLTMKRFFA